MYHLAQLNIARAIADMDDPVMAGFVSRIDEINALADKAKGFIWRFQGDAIASRIFFDTQLVINMSVWESIEDLKAYTYRSVHVELFKERKQWFSAIEKPHLVLWWIKAGHIPSLAEAKVKLASLEENGPNPEAFTFAKAFPKPS